MSMMATSKAPKGYNAFSTFNPQQQQVFQQLIQSLLGGGAGGNAFQSGQNYLQQLLSGSPESTSAFEAPYLRQFNEETIPGLAERFSGLGSGAQSSSAFQNALGQAGAGLQENLAGLREGMRFQAANKPFEQLMQILGLNTQGFAPKQQKQPSFLQQLGLGLSGGIGQGIGSIGSGFGLRKLGLG